tara:strand:- start:4322 stop:5293 length:972 start_codon:yes stop_codon:yes gene_type:complete
VTKPLLELENVEMKYRSYRFGRVAKEFKALDKLSLKVNEGQIFGFLGPNGAGKTTTIKCLTGILQCDKGKIHINGRNIEEDTFDIKNKIGFLPEQVGLYGHLNPKQILEFYGGFYDISKEEIDERSEELLKKLGLSKDANRPVSEFSLGMRKRVALASALLNKPKILILDEPTSGLDPRGVKALRTLLLDLNSKGLTIFLSSHVLSEVQEICTDVGIIDNGKLIRQDKISGIIEEVEKANVRLSLKVKGLKDEVSKILDKKGVKILKQKNTGKHDLVLLELKEKLIPWVTDKLVSENIKIYSIEPQKISLEDVFLKETDGGSE